jgi:EAL domain-containing protein (putative c-di-GMP-specific phosphodiesterase class I)
MYRAKERGRARYEFAESIPASRAAGTTLAPEAFAPAGASPARYEPVVDLGTGAVTAAEACAATRARDAAGLGGALDRACADAAAWRTRLGDAAPALWVDAPVRELGRGTVVDRVARALGTSGLPPHRLSLEIPERHLLGFGPSARADLAALGELGVRIAVDDARGAIGTWPHLDRVPVHLVKIGASVVAGLGARRVDGALASGIIALAHALDLRVVATGVATAGQRQQLRALGCDLAQGDAVHAPVPATDVEAHAAAART